MPDPIDELLKQVEQGNSPRSSSKSAANAANSTADSAPAAAKSIDHLLAELENKPVTSPLRDLVKPPQGANSKMPCDAQPSVRSPERLLQQLDAALSSPKPIAAEPPQVNQPPQPVFERVRVVSGQAFSIQQQRKAIAQKAQAWLDALDPHGGEALFFEKLAEKYPSRLEAAIDFLGLNSEQPQSE